MLRVPEDEVVRAVERLQRAGQGAAKRAGAAAGPRAGRGAGGRRPTEVGGVARAWSRPCERADAKALLELSDRRAARSSATPRWCSARPATAACTWWRTSPRRPSSAASRPATWCARRPQVAGGGGGGRDTMAQAGGRDPEKLPEALAAARAAIERGALA